AYARANWERERGLDELRTAEADVEIIDVPCGHAFEDGYDSWPALKATGATAVIAYNDVVALGLLGRLSEEGVSVPGEISVAGFDDIPLAGSVSPSLTTVQQDTKLAGSLLVDSLIALIRGEGAESRAIPTQLVLRDSSRR
ncbi:substrate-binding domain-containing protein, partial [Paraburkholderia sp. SIMBA_053]|uniref:substrate-binding domain-containing protein n=1 Tax=Paraburkholderia sp. SIMBA_053 TaxID=3085794 RepID=UPI00397908E8